MKNLNFSDIEERIIELMKEGYTRSEAFVQARAERVKDLEARGYGISRRCRFTPYKY